MINNAMLIRLEAYYVKNEKTLGRLDPHITQKQSIFELFGSVFPT